MCASLVLAALLGLASAAPEVPATPPETSVASTTAATAPEAERRRVQRVAVYELRAEGVEPRVARVVTGAVVAELRKLQRIAVVDMDEVRAMLDLEAQKQLVGCSDESCLADIADSLGVDGVVIGTLAAVGDRRIFGLRRIDQREARALGQVSLSLADEGGEEFLAAVGGAVEQLFPDVPLREGQTRGVGAQVALQLNPPPLDPVVFLATAGATAVVGAATVAVAIVNVAQATDLARQLDDSASGTRTTPLDGKAVVAQSALIDQTFFATLGLAAASIAGLAASGVVAAFTDWQGHGDDVE